MCNRVIPYLEIFMNLQDFDLYYLVAIAKLIETHREEFDQLVRDVQASPGAWQGECIHTPGVDCYSGDCCRRPSQKYEL